MLPSPSKSNFYFFRKLSMSIVPKFYHFIYAFSQAIKTRSTTPDRAFHGLEEYIQKTFKYRYPLLIRYLKLYNLLLQKVSQFMTTRF
jgi:hypothetical protein